jgi:hypothetical protein
MARTIAFPDGFTHSPQLYSSMTMVGASKASNKGEKMKNFHYVVCFFLNYFIVAYVFGVHLSSSKALSTSSRCVI